MREYRILSREEARRRFEELRRRLSGGGTPPATRERVRQMEFPQCQKADCRPDYSRG